MCRAPYKKSLALSCGTPGKSFNKIRPKNRNYGYLINRQAACRFATRFFITRTVTILKQGFVKALHALNEITI